ncbi:D-glycero-beta-D-manno-heptose-7-phosphate kinase [Fusobacterium sp. FSA-380-WT-3A]|uniref:D-glycero-beta-D-manno-heptose-7-phosphate kinase n=1 Tax=Fusobacterium sp. FSA-380-WT-3A TaxID=2725304 RepID=UPI0014775B92|nr:D-glycero-beta-D-manno-heptose-7-phosphate kinase [Fusobacterium sp. FSA-380-WT-3A]NME36266.1 D-glycero-beta-D-manno-heptose-7-phosphate kinase [Fusobacterium sp. FSA-380-WT-3A]
MKKERLIEIISNFRKVRLAVIGDIMLDDYLIGSVDRISPEAPVPVVLIKKEKFVLGGAGNVINNLATLGAKSYCYGVVGDDIDGDRLMKFMKNLGVDVSGIIRSEERPTVVKRRVLGGSQQLLRLDWEDPTDINVILEEAILEKFSQALDNIDGIILSDYDKGVLTPKVSKEIIKMARKKGKIVVVDPKPSNVENYIGASSMTPNRKEAELCLGKPKKKTIDEIGTEIREKIKLENLLMTRSEEGVSLYEEDKVTNIPTFAKEVYDVTGAGDTVISVYTLAKAAGATWEEAAKIANTAAGVVVGKIGTSTVTVEEIINFYDEIYKEWN